MRSWANQVQAFYGPLTINAPAGNIGLTVNGVAGTNAASINGSSTSGQSDGLYIFAGTTSADNALLVNNQANTHTYQLIRGDGSGTLGWNGTGSAIQFAAAGNVTISAPSSGDALTATGVSGAYAATFSGANSSTGSAVDIVGSFTGSGNTSLLRLADTNNSNGVNLLLTGNGGTTPNKYIRVTGGQLQIINSAYSTNLLTLSDAGGLQIGAPTGGDQGAGTVNATGLFVKGVAVSTTGSVIQSVTLSVGSSKTSNTTLAVDGTLQVAVAAAGTYKVELFAPSVTGMLTAQGGIAVMFSLSAGNNTYTASGQAFMLAQDATPPSLVTSEQACGISNALSLGSTAFFSPAAYSSGPALQMSGLVVLNAATTVGLAWAQASSSATSTTLPAGTTLVVTKVG